MKGRVTKRLSVPTTIPHLVEAIESIPRRRAVTFEEGPLADWLYRNLMGHADELVVSDPRRNALIAKDSDKDDPIDAEKLANLLRGGYLKPVYHRGSIGRSIFKQVVGLYHDTVHHRVGEANRIMGQLRRWGAFVSEKEFAKQELRNNLMERLPDNAYIRGTVESLFTIYQTGLEQEDAMRRRLIEQARQEEVIRRWNAIPGISWIRSATFFVYLDTPWRFEKKTQLWRYMGIGLERRHSGSGAVVVRLSQQANRALKDAILGAAKSAIAAKDNPFAARYKRWREQGLSHCTARRNVARSLAVTVWSMWKTGDIYRPELVTSEGREDTRQCTYPNASVRS
jgi:transposase